MRNRKFTFTTARAAQVFDEMISVRRIFCADTEFFRMTDFWKDLCESDEQWSIRTYRSNEVHDFKRKAGVVVFGDKVTLTTDARLWKKAEDGCIFSNYILAHELGHVALGHHAQNAVTKNFQLFATACGMSNVPPTLEELETNFAATFLQCGTALLDSRWSAKELAKRAYSDVSYVGKAQQIVRLEVFQRELHGRKPRPPRVVL